MMVATFIENPCTTLVLCSSPTNIAVEKFFIQITSVTRKILKHNV